MKVAVIGGGASGVLAALRIKFNNKDIDVTIFEKNNKLLKKVGMTGNGRCNLGNNNISSDFFYNGKIVDEIKKMGYERKSLEFFEELGLFTISDSAGRIYPKSNQAITVVELLNKELFYRGVNVRLNSNVDNIRVLDDKKFKINDEIFDFVILCSGTNAGISNEGIALIDKLPIKKNEFKPALVGFKVLEDVSSLFGVKATAKVTLGNRESMGEVIFKEDGINGICLMDLSLFYDGSSKDLVIDFLEDYSFDDLKRVIDRKIKNDPYVHLHNIMFGSVNNKLLGFFNQGYPNVKVKTLDTEVLNSYLKNFKEFKLTIKDTYEIKNAQVCKGGISLDEVELFESKKIPGLFICGETLDVAGICGGYNLWFAFTSGIMVADKICK